MAKKRRTHSKRVRRELAAKRAKRKKVAVIVMAVIVLSLATYFIAGAIWEAQTETYSDWSQTVTLSPNGRFSAELSHGVTRSGTFTRAEQGDLTIVSFTQDGMTVTSEIANRHLTIPIEWQDACGHNPVLPKQ